MLNKLMGKKEDSLRRQGIREDKLLAGPETVKFLVTNKCNLGFLYCWHHSPLNPKRDAGKREELDFDVFKRAIDDCRALGTEWIHFAGRGEPTLHPKINEMIRHVKKNGMKVRLLTNATFGKSFWPIAKLVDYFSIDLSAHNAEMYKKMQSTGRVNYFSNVVENISYLSDLKRSMLRPFFLQVDHILNKLNHRDLGAFFAFAAELGVDRLNIVNFRDSLFNKSLNLSDKDVERVKKGLLSSAKTTPAILKTSSNILENLLKRKQLLSLSKPGKAGVKACYRGWYFVAVGTNGDVSPCTGLLGPLKAGNIYETPLRKIWSSDKFHRMRLEGKYHLFHNKYDDCLSCCCETLNKDVRRDLKKAF